MCGVFGLLFKNDQRPLDWWNQKLTRVNEIQKHRGPDQQKFWVHNENFFGLAHQRLSIIDLSSAGEQPMRSHSGQSCLVFNGEIYNHRELKLSLDSGSWRGHSDTEILLETLELKGSSALNTLDGMFAFGFADLEQKRILLATDPAGKKPLYTYWDGKVFAFASEIKSFQAFSELDLSICEDQIKEYMVYGYVPYPNTIYKRVRKLPAGSFQWIDFHRGPEAVQKYWDLSLQPRILNISYADAQDRLRELMKSAVSKRLVADVPVGCFLSGGLDSSIVALEAADILKPESLNTFSIAFNTAGVPTGYDESIYARFVADKIHSRHHEIPIDPNHLVTDFIQTRFDEPFADSSAIPTYFLSQETSKSVKVALSGDGGDEIFGGYRRFRAGLISSHYAWLLKPLLKPLHFEAPAPRSWKGFIKRFKERLDRSTLEQQISWNSYFTEEDFEKYLMECAENIYCKALEFEKLTAHLSVTQKILYYNFKTYLFDDLLPKVDRMSMAHGLEVRSPFLDKALIEFAFALPDSFKVTYFETKRILKDSYIRDFGKSFVRRKKQGFALPIENFIAQEKSEADLKTLRKQWADFRWSHAAFEELQQNNHHHKIYMLMNLERNLRTLT